MSISKNSLAFMQWLDPNIEITDAQREVFSLVNPANHDFGSGESESFETTFDNGVVSKKKVWNGLQGLQEDNTENFNKN